MRTSRIVLGVVYILVFILLLLIKQSSPDHLLEEEASEAIFITTRSPSSIFVALSISYLILFFGIKLLYTKKYLQFILPAVTGFGLLFIAGQVVVQEPYSIEEYFLVVKLREEKFDDKKEYYKLQDLNYFSQQTPEYPEYTSCTGGLFRIYKTGLNNQFKVFNGLGPIFALEENPYKNVNNY